MRVLLSRTVMVTSLVTAVLISGLAATVIAAIPNTDTGVISACRSNTDGTLQVIDKQNSASCGSGQTELSWSSAQTAVAKFNYDPEDPSGPGTYSANASRNIAGTEKIETADFSGYCIHLNFTPRYATQSTYSLYDTDADSNAMAASICGQGYEFFVSAAATTTPAGSIFFSE